MAILIYDFEVFRHDWLVVLKDADTLEKTVIINDDEALRELYNARYENTLFVGYNCRHYDTFIFKTILQGKDPFPVSQAIIAGQSPWQLDRNFSRIKLMSFDCMPNPPVGLKTLEAFLGLSIVETDVSFDIDRKLTPEEIDQTVAYCEHDVDATLEVFRLRKADFESMRDSVKAFKLDWSHIGDTEPRLAATVLGCEKRSWSDEYQFQPLSCVRIKKYTQALDFFRTAYSDTVRQLGFTEKTNAQAFAKAYYSRSVTFDVLGVPHTFGFGGLHGAPEKPLDESGLLYHCDVASYYPSMLIAHGLVTRSAKARSQYKDIYDTRLALKHQQNAATDPAEKRRFKAAQLPYKKILNSLSGAMKDVYNPAYDPAMNNTMCVSGQLLLLDLLERLEESIPGIRVIQSNTDGIIVKLKSIDQEADLKAVCAEWEERCSTDACRIALETDTLDRIIQKDVNNYITMSAGKITERKGAYVKELSALDNDLPIVNKALVAFLAHGVPIEETINSCNELIDFQKVVKLSKAYTHVLKEVGNPTITETGVRVKKLNYAYPTKRYDQKCYRIFASRDVRDGKILKAGGARGSKPEKFATTPEHCRLVCDDIRGQAVPGWLDRQWYIDLAKTRAKHFGA